MRGIDREEGAWWLCGQTNTSRTFFRSMATGASGILRWFHDATGLNAACNLIGYRPIVRVEGRRSDRSPCVGLQLGTFENMPRCPQFSR